MANEDGKPQPIRKLSTSCLQFFHAFPLVLFAIGFSIGVVVSFYGRTFIFKMQTTANLFSSPALSYSTSPLLLPPPPSPSPSPGPHTKLPDSSDVVTSIVAAQTPMVHNIDDDLELFWRALFVPTIREFSYNRVPKVAFMFLTKGPIPLAPLWELFFKYNPQLYNIYVHPHPSHVDSWPESSVFYGRRIPSKHVEWGKPTMIDAERRLLASALLDFSNERFVLLSESCIPLFNLTATYKYLMDANETFLASVDEPTHVGRGRYNPLMAPNVTISDWRKGSQWFEVNRKLAIAIVSDTKYFPIFKKHCKPPCYNDEHYIPTLVNIIGPGHNSNRTITWVDWSVGGAHPVRYGRSDVAGELLNRMRFGTNGTCPLAYGDDTNRRRSMCFLFARKFLPDSLQPLLQIAPMLLRGAIL